MQTVRRLYQYGVALVSLETVLWGAIGLARSILAGQEIGGQVSRLAGALSLILVGVPVFLLHWWLAQRAALKDKEERSSRVRAVFLYAALAATLVPVVQNLLALLDRLLLQAFGLSPQQAFFGGNQSLGDNLIAMLLNGLFAAYLFTVARSDWKASPQGEAFPETRRLYRYLWMLYGLALLVSGVQQLVRFLLTTWEGVGTSPNLALANGLALVLVGAPLWVFVWQRIQVSLSDADEANSMLRLVVLYLLTFVGVGTVLGAAGGTLYVLLRYLLGERMQVVALLGEMSVPLSVAVAFGGLWAYYGRILGMEIVALPDDTETGQRAAGLRRLYLYVLALLGLGATFIGLQQLLEPVIDLLLSRSGVWGSALRDTLAGGLAALAVGAPLWAFTWRPLLHEASLDGEPGDHARRSVVRLVYLYFVLFAAVLGVMFSAGALLFPLLQAVLGDPPPNLLSESLQMLKVLVLFALLLVYHGLALRQDRRLSVRSLARRHAMFPVLVLAPEEGDFATQVVAALEREAKAMPVAVHAYTLGAPDESLSAARAVILPAELAARPSEALRLWLQGYDGTRLVVPTPAPGWHWVFGSGRPLPSLAKQAARMARHLAEGEPLAAPRETTAWTVVLYILGGLLGFVILINLIRILLTIGGFD